MAKYDFDLSEPKGEWSKDKIAFYQAIHNVKLMKDYINKDSKLKREWWADYQIGQGVAYLVVESNDVGIRLTFEFTNTSFIYVSVKNIVNYNTNVITSWNYGRLGFDVTFEKILDILENYFEKFNENKKSSNRRKSLKEYRTVGLEQEVRDKCIEILEDSHSDLFESEALITYDNEGRANTTSSGDVWIDYITLPLYSWSSGSFPSNKKAEKLFNQIIDYNLEYARERLWDEHEDELVELGITGKDDDKLNYKDLYDMDRGDLAEELSEYEMNMEGTELYTQVSCDITEVDDGIELEVSMLIADEYSHALVKDYKSKSVVITEDTKDIEGVIFDCIRSVTENW